MYLDYFGLTRAPYRITPDTDLFYAGGERGSILDALVYAIVSGEAITKVVGEVGSGKTMLCHMLERKLPNTVDVVYLANPSLAPDDVLHAIAFELNLPVSEKDNRLKVMRTLQNHLLTRHAENRQIVVFIEEAQSMPLATLEEIRLLSNLETQQHKLLQVVLFGQPELDEGLSAPHVRQIKERITNSFYLPPLKTHEINDYLAFRLHLTGFRGAPVFSRTAAWLISRFSHGLMRRINIIADKALLATFASGRHIVALRHVIAALQDCEFVSQKFWRRSLIISSLSLFLIFILVGWTQINFHTINQPLSLESTAQPKVNSLVTNMTENITHSVIKNPKQNDQHISVLTARQIQTNIWLTTAAPENLTIQLLWGQSDKTAAVEGFLNQAKDENLLEQLFVYQTNQNKPNVISIVMGEYSRLSQAQAALDALPSNLKRYQPYLRNIRSILAEAETIAIKNKT